MPSAAWEDLEAFVSVVEQLSYADISQSAYFTQLVEGLHRRFSLAQVRVSLFHSAGNSILASRNFPSSAPLPTLDRHRFQPGETQFDRQDEEGHQTRFILDHCFLADSILRIEAQAAHASPLTNHSLQELLGTCAVVAGNFLIRSMGRNLQSQLTNQQRVAAMVSQLAEAEAQHQPPHEICRILQAILEVDRVSLLGSTYQSARLLATSASPSIARNTIASRLLERITAQVSRQSERLRVTIGGEASPAASPMRSDIDKYVDETNVRSLTWIPVHKDEASHSLPMGFVLLEHFSADWPDRHQQHVLELAEPHATHAVRRILSLARNSPLSRLRIALADRGGRYSGLGIILAIVLLLLLTIQKDLEIPVDGVLRPVRRAAIFAPMQGVVDQIPVRHGMHVSTGETLMVLRVPDLEIEERRISGEIATLRSRLESLKSARIRHRASGGRSENGTDLSAEESDLEAQLQGLASQFALVKEQMEFRIVKAPLTGQVDRWDLNQSLSDRPVTHGQYLCEVLDVDGDWMIELSIPDDVVGYVLAAQQQAPCRVSYLSRTNFDREYSSHLESISNSAQLDQKGQPVVLARMPAAPEGKSQFRVGAGIIARIHCGKRSAGFVYLREVIAFFRQTFWF